MYLIDTNVISELRKRDKANPGVLHFFRRMEECAAGVYLSAITVGELRRGVDLIRHRGDVAQAASLEFWLTQVLTRFAGTILPVNLDAGLLWGQLRVPNPENALDKLIAATARVHDMTLATRNISDFAGCSARLLNPFV
ncbi:PIN domain-containing protein [Paracidovorax citrulli]